jgi:hypothetical protein
MLQVMKDVGGGEVPDYLASLRGEAPPVPPPHANGSAAPATVG